MAQRGRRRNLSKGPVEKPPLTEAELKRREELAALTPEERKKRLAQEKRQRAAARETVKKRSPVEREERQRAMQEEIEGKGSSLLFEDIPLEEPIGTRERHKPASFRAAVQDAQTSEEASS